MMVNNKIKLILFFFVFLTSCSFDNKTGIWKGLEDEKKRARELERLQNRELVTIYSSESKVLSEIKAAKSISLSAPKTNTSWTMPDLNGQNFKGNLFLSGVENTFLKKKIGKNKFKISKIMSSPIILENNIILSDDIGTVYSISKTGKVNWKKNIYKKLYKKIYKNLSIIAYNKVLYISDNIGFVYAISLDNGEILWIKNFEIPFKSKIKIFEKKIFLINQDNRILCLSTEDGAKNWDIRSIGSFIKTQNFLSASISKDGFLVTLVSSGDLVKSKVNNGKIFWSLNATASSFAHDTDFFSSSNIVLADEDVVFFASDSIFSFNYSNGYLNWMQDIKSSNTPIIDGKYIFLVSDDGYFLCLDRKTGKIIWSTNILKILKEKKRNTKITGFVMGSGKIYATTLNGFLIISSATLGNVESYKKIGDSITAPPVISEGSLYLLTENSKVYGFN